MRHPRQVLSLKQLLERVWGIDFEAETHVLEVYVGYLRDKLEALPGAAAPRLIHTVRSVGYVLREPLEDGTRRDPVRRPADDEPTAPPAPRARAPLLTLPLPRGRRRSSACGGLRTHGPRPRCALQRPRAHQQPPR